jgi:hypothetical protein
MRMFARGLLRKRNRLSIQRLQDYPSTLLIGYKEMSTTPGFPETLYRPVN